ncbi:MAG: DUF3471 domain-containing protein [Pyrinomonadaceae bacterium]|nr:DUF3471 domain-containing protein [Pyrinomonadaceae bacterium]
MRSTNFLSLFAVMLFLATSVSYAQDKVEKIDRPPKKGPKQSIADTLYKTAKEKGGAEAITEYRKLKSEDKGKYDFSEGELKRLGDKLLRSERTEDAIEIFKLNVEMFPKSSNAYDSLGEAYLADGQLGMGLENFKKALALDPKNKNAAMYVERLEKAGVKKDTKLPKPPKESNDNKSGSAKAVELLKREGKLYESYAGKYEFLNSQLVITTEADRLFVQFAKDKKRELKPLSDTSFSISPIDSIIFSVDSSGKVTGLTIKHHVHKVFAKKIE